MIRIALSSCILLAVAQQTFAADASSTAPRLKAQVEVTGELVRIGDLVENAGAAGTIAVFRAPDLGQTGPVEASRVLEALHRHGLTSVEASGIVEVSVSRLSRSITRKDIEQGIARAIGGQYGFGEADRLAVTIDRDVRTMHVEAMLKSELTIARMNVEPRSGRFDIAFELAGSAIARRLPLRFSGMVTETIETATLTRALQRGDVVRQADVTIERRPKSEVAGEGVGIEDVVGLATRRSLRAGQALRPTDLLKPELVQRNEVITIHYEVPGVSLTARGKALEAGTAGDLINVQNLQSNRTVQATVIGPRTVVITAAAKLSDTVASINSRRSQ